MGTTASEGEVGDRRGDGVHPRQWGRREQSIRARDELGVCVTGRGGRTACSS